MTEEIKPVLKEILEAILVSIDKLTYCNKTVGNGIDGPGYRESLQFVGITTQFTVSGTFGQFPKNLTIDGLILPDSIGHKLDIHIGDKGNIFQIVDPTLHRTYRVCVCNGN